MNAKSLEGSFAARGMQLTHEGYKALLPKMSVMVGMITGCAATALLAIKPAAGGKKKFRVLDALEDEIGLDRTQRAQIEQVLTESQREYRQLQKLNEARSIEIRDSTRARIKTLLMPKQQALFERWIRKRDALIHS
jgi:Spy/CpxP family protein refolding chaperone